MSLFNARTNYVEPSSTSTTPSETTFEEDVLLLAPEPRLPRACSSFERTNDNTDTTAATSDTTVSHEHQSSRFRAQENRGLETINTDYESSAAEDCESFSSGKYENAECAFLSYSRTNKLDKLKVLLEAKQKQEISLDLNYKGQQKQNFSWSALHLACYFGHTQIVEQILSKKSFREEIDINIQNKSGDTPLHKATLTNRARIVQLLLSNGANVFLKNCDGLLAKQLTSEKHIFNMLEAAEQVDRNRIKQEMFKAVDNGDLKQLQGFFDNYSSCIDASQSYDGSSNDVDPKEVSRDHNSSRHLSDNNEYNDLISQMVDERGNTLLHLAAMRGFKAICIYLLEQGLDPYKKNNLGQTCIDLASYQLRQLFMTVKPSSSQIKKLSNQRVTRFEGPLMKKVRILGWKQIYVVLENGVILLFNNRRDSMNKSRRGYKYLESASCEPDVNDLGMFTVCFSDKSRATFLVSPDHLNNYTSFKSSKSELDRSVSPGNQVELVRQKWIDSLRDHIRYSTDFIKNGLKLDDDDDNDINGDLATLNHLLPVDTIKSFMQEARAHYSILERHSESLCNLVQSITASSQHSQSIELNCEDESKLADMRSLASSNTTTGSRLFGLIRPSRQPARGSNSGDDGVSTQTQQSLLSISNRKRNNSLTNEFVQDNWHCILFHLRLLIESTANTKTSMGQALALLEHQEQLRQNRIQDQDERCRVLEDSLHALARDHHELEKSISISQLYHSAAAGRSMSMSTDLNEYFDAFEDFDDEKTMTPNSMPSDEDLNQKIREVMNEESAAAPTMKVTEGGLSSFQPNQLFRGNCNERSDDEDDDDLRSNCSALTVETISDQCVGLLNDAKQSCPGEGDESMLPARMAGGNEHRIRLPAPMVPRDQISIWSILKNCIGKELSKITMPVVFNEPLTMLQRACECIQYSHYLKMADQCDDPAERMEYVCAFIIAGLSANCHRIIKPFNPLLYETYEINHQLDDGTIVKAVAQQVSHHPPITAALAESDYFIYSGSVNPKIKFWGRSVEVQPDGQCRVYLKNRKETYLFKAVSCSIHNIIVGKLWFEHYGPLEIKCIETNVQANLTFRQAGWFSNDLHRFDGTIILGNEKKVRFVYGKWSDYLKSVDYSEYEKFIRDNQKKPSKVPDLPIDLPNSKTIWELNSHYFKEYYNFTLYTMRMNELTEEMAQKLPRSDSRFRTDVRKLEEGDLDGAASEKHRLEEKQREARVRDIRFKNPSSDLLWFDLTSVPYSKEKFWTYKGGYWDNRCNPEKFPDLF